jgi:hypothetical protein
MVICSNLDESDTKFIDYVEISTLEGTMRGDLGDWVIQGIAGELYPCAHDIFINSYEEAEFNGL